MSKRADFILREEGDHLNSQLFVQILSAAQPQGIHRLSLSQLGYWMGSLFGAMLLQFIYP